MPKSAETKKTGVNLVEKKKRDSMNTIGTRKSIGVKANLEKSPADCALKRKVARSVGRLDLSPFEPNPCVSVAEN